MKARITLYILIFFACLGQAWAGNTGNKVYISGIIKHYKTGNVYFSYIKDYLYFQERELAAAVTDKNGKFQVTFDWSYPWIVDMSVEGKKLSFFLCPGDSLLFEASYGNLYNSIEYSGNAGKGHNLLKKYLKDYGTDNARFQADMPELGEREFLSLNDQRHQEQMKFVDKNYSEEDNKYFYAYLMALVNYSYYDNLFEYCNLKNKYFDQDYIEETIDPVDINNELAIAASIYIKFAENYLTWKSAVMQLDAEEGAKNYWIERYKICKNTFSGKVRDLLLARLLKKAFEYTYPITAMNLYNDYANIYINRDYFFAIKNNFIK